MFGRKGMAKAVILTEFNTSSGQNAFAYLFRTNLSKRTGKKCIHCTGVKS